MKNRFRTFISCFLYVAALIAFLVAIIATDGNGGVLDFSDLARIIYCTLAVICVVIATLVWKAKDSRGKRNKVFVIVIAVAFIVGGGFVDDYLEHNTGTHEYTADMYKISQASAAKFETSDGRSVMVDSEIDLLASLAEYEIQQAPMTPADNPEDWIYRITYDPIEKVPGGEEIVVYVHEKYLQIGAEYYLPTGNESFDGILGWFDVMAEYFMGSNDLLSDNGHQNDRNDTSTIVKVIPESEPNESSNGFDIPVPDEWINRDSDLIKPSPETDSDPDFSIPYNGESGDGTVSVQIPDAESSDGNGQTVVPIVPETDQ